jgi:hypothetical protein
MNCGAGSPTVRTQCAELTPNGVRGDHETAGIAWLRRFPQRDFAGASANSLQRDARYAAMWPAIRLHKRSFAPIGPGTVPVETVKVIRPNHVSGLSRINVLQSRKRCTGQQKGSPFCVFPTI